MSEFISICPKCRQQILCDTAYIGKRIACPVCMQEITMPEPPQQTPQGDSKIPTPEPAKPSGVAQVFRNPLVLAGVIGAVVVIVGTGAVIFADNKNSKTINPAAAATSPAQAAAPSSKPALAPAGARDQCSAIWPFDQDSGKTVTDATGNGNDATLVGTNVTWIKSAKNGSGALRLGGSSYAEAPGPVINTAQSFTVTAWANFALIDRQNNQTVVSIDGKDVSGFYLMLNSQQAIPQFDFIRYPSDNSASTRARADGTFTPVPHRWYHLAGVYDADAKTLSLYVDGKWQSITPYKDSWQAKGKTIIGRGLFYHEKRDFVNGMISDVRLYSTALTAAQIQALAAQ